MQWRSTDIRRVQKHGKTAEDFTADEKCMQDKAYKNLDRHTRGYDLVRWFDGLLDQDARFAVEFNKSSNNIDEAVSREVSYNHMRNCGRVDRNRWIVRRAADETAEGDKSCDKKRCQLTERTSRPFIAHPPAAPEVDAEIQQELIRKFELRKRAQCPSTKTGKAQCNICHQVGHFARDCLRRTEAALSGSRRDCVTRSKPLNFRESALEARGSLRRGFKQQRRSWFKLGQCGQKLNRRDLLSGSGLFLWRTLDSRGLFYRFVCTSIWIHLIGQCGLGQWSYWEPGIYQSRYGVRGGSLYQWGFWWWSGIWWLCTLYNYDVLLGSNLW